MKLSTVKYKIGIKTLKFSIEYDNYSKSTKNIFSRFNKGIIPCIMPNFDHTPRSGVNGYMLKHPSPNNFRKLLKSVIKQQSQKLDDTKDIIFLKSWNEWGEGNYVEPDLEYGHGFLSVLKEELKGRQ